MRWNLFLEPFFLSFVVSASLSLFFMFLPFFRKRSWRSGERHEDLKRRIPRLGGVAMLIAFFVAVLFDKHLYISQEILGFLIGTFLVLIFGFWDDIVELGWRVQIFFQIALTLILFVFGMRISSLTNPLGGVFIFPQNEYVLLSFLLLFIWLLLVMNAVNWLDGLDGLSGGVSLITFITIFFLSLKPEVNQPPIAILSIIGAGVTLGFLLFNFHPARIVAGTVGSMFLGFFITVLAVIAGTKIATALLVLSLPIADALWVILERLRAGVSIFQPDKRHLHYRLRELGWSEGRIAWFFSGVTAVIALIALHTEALGKFIALLLVLVIIFLLLFFVHHRTKRLSSGT